jgi:two-component system, NarL family, nitrate/nitrite response regulator NarL
VTQPNHRSPIAADKPQLRSAVTTVLIAEARVMAAEAMVRAIQEARGLTLSSPCACRGDVAVACVDSAPDVAVLDLVLYEHEPRYAVGALREHAVTARILLMTPEPNAEQLARAVVAGAENCISSHVDTDAFLRAVRATADARSILGPALQRKVMSLIVELGRTNGHRLSPREREVLCLAATGIPVGEIADQLFISASTAKTHLLRGYRKLGVKNRGGAIARAMRTGVIR